MELLLSWLILTIIVLLTAAIVPGVTIRGFWGAVLVAGLLGVLNFLIGWFLFVVIGLATLGLGFVLAFLTRLVVDALLLKMIDKFTHRLTIVSFGRAFLAALVMAGLGTLFEMLAISPRLLG